MAHDQRDLKVTYLRNLNFQIIFFYHGLYLEEEKSMIHSFTITFRAKYLTGMVTSIHPYNLYNMTIVLFSLHNAFQNNSTCSNHLSYVILFQCSLGR
jgi:hypothetical protein